MRTAIPRLLRLTPYLCVCLANLLMAQFASGADLGLVHTKTLRANVVLLASREASATESGEYGIGIIIGSLGGRLAILTPAHVAWDESGRPRILKARLFGSGDVQRPVEVLRTSKDFVRDISVVAVAPPPGFSWERKCLDARHVIEENTPVRFIGRANDWYVPVSDNARIRSAEGDSLVIEHLEVEAGSSGAPIVTTVGIVGMHRSSEGSEASARTMTSLLATLRRWPGTGIQVLAEPSHASLHLTSYVRFLPGADLIASGRPLGYAILGTEVAATAGIFLARHVEQDAMAKAAVPTSTTYEIDRQWTRADNARTWKTSCAVAAVAILGLNTVRVLSSDAAHSRLAHIDVGVDAGPYAKLVCGF